MSLAPAGSTVGSRSKRFSSLFGDGSKELGVENNAEAAGVSPFATGAVVTQSGLA